jgi:lipopolysaccharide/colanic/teichoic acid biosynthesis glycosyltransferase
MAALWLWHTGGLGLILMIASYSAWGSWQFWEVREGRGLIVLTLLICAGAATLDARLALFPRLQAEQLGALLVGITAVFLVISAVLVFGRLEYSRTFLLVAYVLFVFWCVLDFRCTGWRPPLRLALAPGGIAAALEQLPGAVWHRLSAPTIEEEAIDGLVVDLHQPLAPQWVHFLAECSLRRVPTFHAAALYEALTGQVSIDHLREGYLAGVPISATRLAMKRTLEGTLVFLFLPVIVPLVLATALAVKAEMPRAPVLFWQTRVGQGGRRFRMVKFRSMIPCADVAGAQFARDGDDRATRVGRFIRKYRLDELPQVWNILRGEMSLIGPRPEQAPFVEQFAQALPFYSYRHLVAPGITGWAQVNQGYADGEDATRVKLQYDLYYIRHFSFWLDLLIAIRTVRVLLTGFGAR